MISQQQQDRTPSAPRTAAPKPAVSTVLNASAGTAPPAANAGASLSPEQIEQRRKDAASLAAAAQRANLQQANATSAYNNGGSADQQHYSSVDALDASREVVARSQGATQSAQVNSGTSSTANFAFNERQTASRQDADAAVKAAEAYKQQVISEAHGGIPDIGRLMEADQRIGAAQRSQDVSDLNAQSSNGGVQRTDQRGNAGGIAGFFGATTPQSNFTATPDADPNAANNRQTIQDRVAGVDSRATKSMQGAQVGQTALANQANINMSPQDQLRQRQLSLADSLNDAAAGNGPSAAQAQLQAGTDASINSALALAHSGRGGNSSVALKNALMQNGNTMQQASTASAQLKAQEQQAARAQLGSVLDSSRGADIGVATSQAGLDQQTNFANAGAVNAATSQQAALDQATSTTNLTSAVDQQKQNDALVLEYQRMGMSADQANQRAKEDMAKFNAELLARQEAARNGQTLAAGAQQTAAIGSGIAAVGGVIASAVSDKRAKKNITDGEDEAEVFLRSLRPHGFEYKDEAFGKGHHLGVMAQDVERGAPDIVIDDTDGVKKLDIRKALSASLASLGSLDSRLAKIEGKKRG